MLRPVPEFQRKNHSDMGPASHPVATSSKLMEARSQLNFGYTNVKTLGYLEGQQSEQLRLLIARKFIELREFVSSSCRVVSPLSSKGGNSSCKIWLGVL